MPDADQMNFTTRPTNRNKVLPLAISLFLGVAIATTGWILVDRVEEQMTRRISDETGATVRLGQTLLQSTLRIGSAGMRELTSLPLISEFLEIAGSGPESVEAEELKLYLQEVLSITYGELGADALLAADRNGEVHLEIPENFNEPVPEKFTGTGAFLATAADGSPQLWMRQPVPGYDKPDDPAGVLYLKFPDTSIADFKRAGLALRTVSGMQDVADSGGSDFGIRVVTLRSPKTAGLLPIRIFALAAGFAVFLGLASRVGTRASGG